MLEKQQKMSNGVKPQLLILPGWEGSKTSWKNFVNLAQNDFEVYCLELPCFGQELCPHEVWGVAEYAEFVRQKIKELHLNKPILLGHSFGGQIAAYLAANESAEFSRLILSGAAVSRPSYSFKRLFFDLLAKTGKIFFQLPLARQFAADAKKFLYRLADSPDYNDTSGIKREIFKKVIRQDITGQLAKINLPVLIVWGTRDSYVPLKVGKKLAKLIKNSQLKIIPGGRHGLHINQPANFYKIIKEFLG